jgi:hypothetical protein
MRQPRLKCHHKDVVFFAAKDVRSGGTRLGDVLVYYLLTRS